MIQVSNSEDELEKFSSVRTHSQRFKGRRKRNNATREEERSSRTPCGQGQRVSAQRCLVVLDPSYSSSSSLFFS